MFYHHFSIIQPNITRCVLSNISYKKKHLTLFWIPKKKQAFVLHLGVRIPKPPKTRIE